MFPVLSMMSVLQLPACTAAPQPLGAAPPLQVAQPGHLRLAVVGDAGKGNATQREVAAALAAWCAAEGCDAVLLAGDLLYPRGMESPTDPRAGDWIEAPYIDSAPRLLLALGNHDYGHGRSEQKAEWLVAWAAERPGVELPQRHYEVELAGVPGSVMVLDTNTAFQFDEGPQQAWLADRLPAIDGWRIVLGHHPFRSDGTHGNAGAYEGWRGLPYLSGRALEALFTETLCPHADVYLSGHDHNLQLIEHCDVQLVVSGAGASTTPIVDRGNDPSFAAAEAGFVWLSLGDDGQGEAVAVSGEGEVLHRQLLRRRLRASP